MKPKDRNYISVYFSGDSLDRRKRRDVTVAFDLNDGLYEKVSPLGSCGIRTVIGIDSYSQLVREARKEDRPLSNYIKHRLRVHLLNEEKNPSG